MAQLPGLSPGLPGLPGVGGGALPGLGQGVRGGLGNLPGSGGLGGGQLLPGLQPVRAPRIQGPGVANPGTLLNLGAQQHTQNRLDAARALLQQVDAGGLKANQAAKQLLELTPVENGQLQKELVSDAKSTGTNHDEALQALGMDPKLAGFITSATHKSGGITGVTHNLLNDVSSAIYGMPAGLAKTGVAVGEDIKDAPGRTLRGKDPFAFQHTGHEIIAPMAKSYEQTYGPLVHGDFGKFAHGIGQHPLGPILDAASLLSAGLGTAARVGAASNALRAARVVEPELNILDAAHGQALSRLARRNYTFEHIPAGEAMKSEDRAFVNSWRNKDASDMSQGAISDHEYYGESGGTRAQETRLGILRDKEGNPQSVGDFRVNPDELKVGSVGAGEHGAGLAWLQHLIREFPDRKVSFFATKENVPYYERMGAKVIGEDDPRWMDAGDMGQSMEIPAKKASEFANAGKGLPSPPVTGPYPVHVMYDAAEMPAARIDRALRKALPKGMTLDKEGDAGTIGERSVKTNSADQAVVVQAKLRAALKKYGLDHDVQVGKPQVFRPGPTVATVGDNAYTVHLAKNGLHKVFDPAANETVGVNFPDRESAIKHAQSLVSPFAGKPIQAYLKGGGARGQLLERYQQATGFDHSEEVEKTMKEVGSVLEDPNLKTERRSLREVGKQVKANLKATAMKDISGVSSGATSQQKIATIAAPLREGMDMVRTGAIYAHPAYLPNNWAGNLFMNTIHQGVLAPVNLGKSLVMDKYIGKRYTAAIDKAMGHNPLSAIMDPKSKGYVSSITEPLARSMGMIADQPFRRAAFLHEARRAGYTTLADIKKLFDDASGEAGRLPKNQPALRQIGEMSRKAQEEIVKFGDYNATEREIVRHLIFVYSWMRGATRYAARFGLQHPIQTNVYSHLSQTVGQPWLHRELGGVPNFMAGAIPVGRDSKGNSIVINPFNLNPLGSGLQAAQSVGGTLNILRGKPFDKYTGQDVTGMMSPLIQAYLQRWAGGKKTPLQQVEKSIAPYALYQALQHPNTGSIYPTSRIDALGHYIGGSLFPRPTSAAALQRSLARSQQGDPVARMPNDISTIEKALGKGTITPEFQKLYTEDLANVARQKSFQDHYASSHGQSGFRNLPAINRVDAALEFLSKGYMSPQDVSSIRASLPSITDDATMSSLASSLWSSTGFGQMKLQWDQMLNQARKTQLTPKRG